MRVRVRVLVLAGLYYFKKKEDEDKDKPCGYIPLENLDVKDLVKGASGRKHCFMVFF